MYTMKVKNNNGKILDFSTSDAYTVYKVDGLTPPKANINVSANTAQDGSTVNSTRLYDRNIVIYLVINGDIEANRIKLYDYFTPKKNITLYFQNGSRNVYIDGIVELIECNIFSSKQTAQISIICPKPYFKDDASFTANFSDISSLFEFPFSIPVGGIEVSAITNNIRKSIINVGDIETGAIIKLFANGAVSNPVIYDVLNRTELKLNIDMLPLDTIIINTNVGEKSIKLIRNGVERNAMGYMSPDSTWLTLASGDNVFTYDCDSGNEYLQITFTTSILYGGV